MLLEKWEAQRRRQLNSGQFDTFERRDVAIKKPHSGGSVMASSLLLSFEGEPLNKALLEHDTINGWPIKG